VNKLTGEKFFDKEGSKTVNREFLRSKNRSSYSQESTRNNSYLFPLVSKGTDIHLEEEKIKEKLNEEYKRKKKRELLLNTRSNRSFKDDKFESKYPLSKKNYETIKKVEQEENPNSYKINDSESDKIDKKIPSNIMELIKTKSLPNQNEYLNMISKSSNCGPYFLEAYNKVAEKEIKRLNYIENKNKMEKTFEYIHPGTYREFVFMENIYNPDNIQPPTVTQKKVTESLWSCCMNSDKNSRGCQKRAIRNFRWIYNP
jgi:hypothetical protein